MPPPVMCAAGVECVTGGTVCRQDGRGVDDRGAQQLVGDGDVGTHPRRVAEIEPGSFEQDMTGECVTVRAQAGRRQPDHGVARGNSRGPELSPVFDRPYRKTGKVELVGCHDACVFRRLSADQRTAGSATAVSDAADDGGDPLRVDLASGDVVEHEQWLGSHTDQVIDAHGDEVDANGLVPAGRACDEELRAHPVGGRDQHGLLEASDVEWELAAEAADASDDGTESIDRRVAGCNVDAGGRVGGAALTHRTQTPGSAAWCADAMGSDRPMTTGAAAAGTGVG